MNRLLYATRARRSILEYLRSVHRYVTAAELLEHLHGQGQRLARSTGITSAALPQSWTLVRS